MSWVAYLKKKVEMHELIKRWADDSEVLLLDNGSVVKVVKRVPHIRTYDLLGKLSVFDSSSGDSTLLGGNIENVFTFMFRRFLCVNRDGHCYSRKHEELYYYGRVDLESVSKITSGYEKSFLYRELYVLTDLVEKVTKFFGLVSDVPEAIFGYAKVEERLSHVNNVLKLAGGKSTNLDITVNILEDVEQLLSKRHDVMKVINSMLVNNGGKAIATENELLHAINQNLVSDQVVAASIVMKETGFRQFPKHLSKLEGLVPKGVKYLDTLDANLTWLQALERRLSGVQTTYFVKSLADIGQNSVLRDFTMIGFIEFKGQIVLVSQSGQEKDDWASYRLVWSAVANVPLFTYPDANGFGPVAYGWLI
uniref:2b protein n=1 Tax=Tobacco rattle virus TaxID=12295 RepID=A0A0U3TEL2_9VIRU|nr:2b protein [Tobacco rattle virus]